MQWRIKYLRACSYNYSPNFLVCTASQKKNPLWGKYGYFLDKQEGS